MTAAMLSHALYASFADSAEQRASDRRVLRLEARVATPAGEGGIKVHNLSRTGMLIESGTGVPVGTMIEVELPGGAHRRAEVVWADEGLLGCRFAKPLSQAVLSAALLRSAPLTPSPSADGVLARNEAVARLREHWTVESATALPGNQRMPPGLRMWIIGGLGLASWVALAATVWLVA